MTGDVTALIEQARGYARLYLQGWPDGSTGASTGYVLTALADALDAAEIFASDLIAMHHGSNEVEAALRAALEAVTRERDEAIQAHLTGDGGTGHCAVAEQVARERDAAVAAIEDAPHAGACARLRVYSDIGPCDCWKSRALAALQQEMA